MPDLLSKAIHGLAKKSEASRVRYSSPSRRRESSSDKTASPRTTERPLTKQSVHVQRRRLSVMATSSNNDGVEKTVQSIDRSTSTSLKKLMSGPEEGRKFVFKAASYTKTGVVPYNGNKVNQDSFFVHENLQGHGKLGIWAAAFGVFDGHGVTGHFVSEFVKNTLPRILVHQDLEGKPIHSLSTAFEETNRLLSASGIDVLLSGTTATVAMLMRDRVYVANAGDSRCVLGRSGKHGRFKAVDLSRDHKPENPKESKRILKHGGRVCKPLWIPHDEEEEIGPARVWLMEENLPGLAMSRSLGDAVAHSVGVISTPEVTEHILDSSDKLLILGSDGVFEFMTSDEVIALAARHTSPETAASAIVIEASRRWKAHEDCTDDITCITVFLKA